MWLLVRLVLAPLFGKVGGIHFRCKVLNHCGAIRCVLINFVINGMLYVCSPITRLLTGLQVALPWLFDALLAAMRWGTRTGVSQLQILSQKSQAVGFMPPAVLRQSYAKMLIWCKILAPSELAKYMLFIAAVPSYAYGFKSCFLSCLCCRPVKHWRLQDWPRCHHL